MKKALTIITLVALLSACANSQQQAQPVRQLIGPCEGCEAIFEYGNKSLKPIDTLPDFTTGEGPRIKLTGTIYQPDGKTPAPDVILYIYHTNAEGIYPKRGGETGWDRRHGYIRGWIKTDANGRYLFYTRRPGNYPGRTAPAHVHATILEPNGRYYWVHDYFFKDDPVLSKEEIAASVRGGGEQVLSLQQEGNLLVGRRDFILGKNVPGYER